MIYFHCKNEECGFVARVHVGEDMNQSDYLLGAQSEWYPDRYPCPECGSLCLYLPTCDGRKRVTDLTPHEAFLAFSGVGLPSEQECGATAVTQLLTGARITGVVTRHIRGTNRCCLDEIVLETGQRIYLGASSHGSCVYRVRGQDDYARQHTSDSNDLAASSASR